MSPQRTDKPAEPAERARRAATGTPQPGAPTGQSWRWLWGVLAIGIVAILLAVGTIKTTNAKSITYTKFLQDVTAKQVSTAKISNSTGVITGNLKNGTQLHGPGPEPVAAQRRDRPCATTASQVSFPTPSSNLFTALLPYLFIIGIGAAFIYFISRQAQGQMSGIMSIGRSKAKTFTTDRPSTTFDDVAGYDGVKQEISEVVDFLKTPARFKEIGAKIPKGVLLVGPPGHRQDAARPGRGRRGRRALHVGERLGLHGDVRRRRGQPGARPVPDGPQAGAGHRLRRRDRLHRPQARRRPRRRPRRARADPQPDALRDGRLRHHRGRGHDRGHQPARHPRPRPAAPGPLRPPDRGAPARPRGAPAHPAGPLQGQAHGDRRRPRRGGPGHARA